MFYIGFFFHISFHSADFDVYVTSIYDVILLSTGINSTLEDWRTFLTQTLTGALAAPHDLFRKVNTNNL